ncbi:MAG: thiol:disulfide interchange protein DsbE [Porticoccaceae bacterium]|nr:MAG: thiol:disulfide interchange protein DsbE [Porticoccaceae bacterium]
MKRLVWFAPALAFLALAALLYLGLGRDPEALPSALVGRPVPAFALPDLADPQRQITEAVFTGEVTLLNVWATWCSACRTEHPFLMELARRGVRILGMNYKDRPDAARVWLERLGNPYALTFIDPLGTYGVDLGVYGAPETYLIDARGVIRARHVGVLDAAVWAELEPLYQRLREEAR